MTEKILARCQDVIPTLRGQRFLLAQQRGWCSPCHQPTGNGEARTALSMDQRHGSWTPMRPPGTNKCWAWPPGLVMERLRFRRRMAGPTGNDCHGALVLLRSGHVIPVPQNTLRRVQSGDCNGCGTSPRLSLPKVIPKGFSLTRTWRERRWPYT